MCQRNGVYYITYGNYYINKISKLLTVDKWKIICIVIYKEGKKIILLEEKRNQKRNSVNLPIIYAFSSENRINVNHGTTFDISDSGIGFYTDKPLLEGLNLQVHLSHVWDFPKSSVVQWCIMKNVNLYRVGLAFQS